MSEQLSADFVVIGSGIIGSNTAHRFLKQGASVIILEADPRVTRDEIVARFRNSTRKSDRMSPYPSVPWAPHPVYQPTTAIWCRPDSIPILPNISGRSGAPRGIGLHRHGAWCPMT